MTCGSCVQFPLDVDVIDASIYTQRLKIPRDLLVHFEYLDNGRNPYIGLLKKEKGDIFSECYTESFKAELLRKLN